MSTLIDALITQSAREVPNPDRTRIKTADWLEFYNSVSRDIGARLYAVRYTALFDWQADSDYDYPDEMTRMIALWAREDNTDNDAWTEVRELREDELRDRTNRQYPTGVTPERYHAQATIYRVVPRPTATIVRGGKLEYWGLPDEILSASGTYMVFPDMMREWVVEGMVINALRVLKQIAEARDRYAAWEQREPDYATRLTDRSDDKRPAFVPRAAKRGPRGHI